MCDSELPCRVNEYSHWINLHEQVDRHMLRCQDLMTQTAMSKQLCESRQCI